MSKLTFSPALLRAAPAVATGWFFAACSGFIEGDPIVDEGTAPTPMGTPMGTPTPMGGAGGTPGPAAGCPTEPAPAPAGSVRLTDRQFRNTIAALFPFPVDVGAKYPASSFKQDFTTSLAANQVLFADIQSFAETAESIALQAVTRIGMLLPCNPAGNEAACARQFIDGFGARAFRRPLEPAERDQLARLYDGARLPPDALDFNLAIAAVIAATLQSPQFLYRLELGAPARPGMRRLTPYEVAANLSYLYWDAPPDAALLEKARAGGLADGKAIEAETARLLADPRARDSAWRFFSEWLGFGDRVFDGRADRALAADFGEEARRFVLGVVFDSAGAPLPDLLDNDKTVMNRRLARHYGVASDSTSDADWRPVTLPQGQRSGVLGKAQVATAHSPVGDTSVVMRGHFVTERLLCVELGPPPPGAQSMNPVLSGSATVRERIDARLALPGCGGCHRLLDNAGIGMEDVDHLGRVRSTYPSGRPVDAAGSLVALEAADQSFVGTAGLARKLARSGTFAACVSRQWYRYALARHESEDEARCQVARMTKRFADGGYNLRELLSSVSGSDAFVLRGEGGARP